MATTPSFGIKQLAKTTPVWAQWMFRIALILFTVAGFIIAGDPGIPADLKVRVLLYLQGATAAMYGFSKLFGINLEQEAPQA